jgi:hypothetical protein
MGGSANGLDARMAVFLAFLKRNKRPNLPRHNPKTSKSDELAIT